MVLRVIPLAQSVMLADYNLKKLKKKKKMKTEDFMKSGVTNIVGATMIAETAHFTGSF